MPTCTYRAVNLVKRAVLEMLAHHPASDNKERNIGMSRLASVVHRLSVECGRDWTAAQEGLSFKQLCSEIVVRRSPQSHVQIWQPWKIAN